VEASKQ